MKLFLRTLVLAAGVSLGLAGPPPEIAEPVRVLRAVGLEGQGNAAASVAWKKLAAGNATTLRPLLEAMDGANDYALNWLRAAVEAVASREMAAGHPLPLPELKQFLQHTEHNPRARRLAFELVARVAPATADQLLAGMLDDPSLELRRDAVQKLIDQADQALARTNLTAAAPLLQSALRSARDVTQIEDIAGKLQGLGQPVDLQKHFGFLVAWKVIGPFDNTGNQGFETAYPPEVKIDLAAEYDGKKGKVRWQDYVTTHKCGMVDMNQPCGKLKGVTAYATTDFYSDRARPVAGATDLSSAGVVDLAGEAAGDNCVIYLKTRVFVPSAQAVIFELGSDDGIKLWVNGEVTHAHNIDPGVVPGADRATAKLHQGWNDLLAKITQNGGGCGMSLRITAADGAEIPGLRFDPRGEPNPNTKIKTADRH